MQVPWICKYRSRLSPLSRATRAEELEFLPAALELRQTPPPPLGRAILWTIVGLCLSAVAWASVGRVDIVAIAPGRLLPAGHVKIVQSPGTGIVTAIHVNDGQRVRAGEVLIELDPTLAEADRKITEEQLHSAELELSRLRAFHSWLTGQPADAARAVMDPEFASLQRSILEQSIREHRSRRDVIGQAIARREADREAARRQVEKLRRTLPLVAQRATAMRGLAERDLLPRLQSLEVEQQLIAAEQDLGTARAQLVATGAAIAELSGQRRELESSARRAALQRISELEKTLSAARQEQVKMARVAAQQRLHAPVAGEVQQLAVHTVGGVVRPGEPLLVIVPDGEPLEVEARILNRDIGFVREGQAASIKVDAFPFTRYGAIAGRVVSISDDALPDERLGLVYLTRLRPARTDLDVDGRSVPLASGMAVSVEILTGRRSVLDFVLSPLSRHLQESGRER